MTLPYTQDREINDRYVNTIIFYGNTPIMIRAVANGQIQYLRIGTGQQTVELVNANDKALRDGPFTLGYINGVQRQIPNRDNSDYIHITSAIYTTRMPVRRSKQGITAENLIFKGQDRTYQVSFNKMCPHPGFRAMMAGEYPSYRKALATLDDKHELIAFAPRIAVGINNLETYDLHYRGDKVATAVEGDHWVLGKKFKFLKEYLQTQGVHTY